jgi:hypothetical protein
VNNKKKVEKKNKQQKLRALQNQIEKKSIRFCISNELTFDFREWKKN